jgi:hypothetical protein
MVYDKLMPVWSFYDFAEDRRSVITPRLANFADVKDKLDSILLKLRVMELPWPPNFCKPYRLPKKAKEKLFEIRVDHLNVEYRFLGCFGPTVRAFTILAVGVERDFKLQSGVIEIARSRSHLIADWRNIGEHKLNN